MGLGWLFAQADWVTIFFFSLIVALITLTPEFYAMVKAPARWIPINSPPFMIGDDYHYFSMLNNVHRRFLNRLYGTHLVALPLSANSKFQLCGYLLNIIPYHIGYLLADRRLGVVFVRIWNRLLLGISTTAFSMLLYKSFGAVPTTEVLLLTYIVFFLLFPGPFGRQINASIARQIGNHRYIYDRANANDLTRAMFSETTGPLIITACTLLLVPVSEQNATPLACGELLFVVILFFHYFPAAFVFSWLVFLVQLGNGFIYVAMICALMTLGLAFLYLYSVSRDEVGKEIFAHSDGGKFITVSRGQLFNAALIILCVVAVILLIPEMRKTTALLIFMGSGFFICTHFFVKHQASRFWDRAAIIPFQLMATVSFLAIVLSLFSEHLTGLLIFTLSFTLFYYYYRQSIFLYQARATLLPPGVEFERDICPPQSNGSTTSRTVATNSIGCANSVDLFSKDVSLLRNYSIQSLGYKKHLMTICANFKVLGIDYIKFERLLTLNVNYRDWQFERPIEQGSGIAERCYAHTLQYVATNREYNAGLVAEGMYSSEGWTGRYKALLRTTWDSIDTSKVGDVDTIFLEKPF